MNMHIKIEEEGRSSNECIETKFVFRNILNLNVPLNIIPITFNIKFCVDYIQVESIKKNSTIKT